MVKKLENYITIAEACSQMHVQTFALYKAIHLGKLPAIRLGKLLYVKQTDLDGYRINKHNPDFRRVTKEGPKLYDMETHFSVNQIAKIVSAHTGFAVDRQRLYYLIRKGSLKSYRSGGSLVLKKEDVMAWVAQEFTETQNLKYA